jgi:general secretion pathway protein C
MFVLLIFCGQQGYLTFKDYKKVTNKLANSDESRKKTSEEKTFSLFTAAVRQDNLSGGKSPAGCGN